MLDYPRYLAEGYQIGSGPTESQCKSLASRLKGRGRRWNCRGIQAHLALNCLYHEHRPMDGPLANAFYALKLAQTHASMRR